MRPITLEKLAVRAKGEQMRVIICEDSELIMGEELYLVHTFDGFVESDTERDILKPVILNRYQTAPPIIIFIKGTGLKLGTIAQSISYDDHGITVIGVTDPEFMQTVNVAVEVKGEIAASCMDEVTLLPLPVAGLMNGESLEEMSRRYEEIKEEIKRLKPLMDSSQMTPSFMGLLVVPSLKPSNKGLLNSETFQFTSLFVW